MNKDLNTMSLEALLGNEPLAPKVALEDGQYTGLVAEVTTVVDEKTNKTSYRVFVKVPNMLDNICIAVFNTESVLAELRLAYGFRLNTIKDLKFKNVTVYVHKGARKFSPILPEGVHDAKFLGATVKGVMATYSIEIDGVKYHHVVEANQTSDETYKKSLNMIVSNIRHLAGQLNPEGVTFQDFPKYKGATIKVNVPTTEYKTLYWNFDLAKMNYIEQRAELEAAVTQISDEDY